CVVENANLGQGLGIVGKHPSMIRVSVTIGGKGNVERVIAEEQRGTLQVFERVKGDDTIDAPISGPLDFALDHHRGDLLCAGGHVERMNAMKKGSVLLGCCLDVEGPAVRIDDRGARNPDFWSDRFGAADIGTGYGRDTGGRINETRLPERGAGR